LAKKKKDFKRIDSKGKSAIDQAEESFRRLEDGVPLAISDGNVWGLYNAVTHLSNRRLEKYRDFDLMEEDSLLASALELVADDVCQFSMEKSASIWSKKGANAAFIDKIFKQIQIEDRIWGWCYNVAKYGDMFLRIRVDNDMNFLGVDDSIHPMSVKRIDLDGVLAAFAYSEKKIDSINSEGKVIVVPPWHFVHFINNYKPYFESVRLSDSKGKKDSKGGLPLEKVLTSRYGTSIFEAARKEYRVLSLLEQTLAIARLTRTPIIRVFYVNTSGMDVEKREETLKRLEARFKKRNTIDFTKDLYRVEKQPMSFNTDLFIPYTNNSADMRSETIGGEVNIKDIVDIEYRKSKLFNAIRIPKAFMGFEDGAFPGAGGQTTLVRMDIRYARMAKKIQRSVISGVSQLLSIAHSLVMRKPPSDPVFAIKMETISGVEELDRMAGLERKMGVGQQLVSLMRDLGETTQVDPTPVFEYVFSDILGLSELNLKFKKKPSEDQGDEGGGGFQYQSDNPILNALLKETMSGQLPLQDFTNLVIKMGYSQKVTKALTHPDNHVLAEMLEQTNNTNEYKLKKVNNLTEITCETLGEDNQNDRTGSDTITSCTDSSSETN
jgi:hypothetical protein